MIKKILFILAGLIVALLLIGFVLPGKLEVTKSVSIQAPASAVFEEINDLKRWETWQYWNTLDPTDMKIKYVEKTVGTGASYSWDSPVLKTGTITLTESIPDKSVAITMDFDGNPANGVYALEPDGENTKLNLNFYSDAGMNPIGRWINVFMKGEIEKSFDYAGEKIKTIAEAKPKFTYAITEETLPAISYVGLIHTMSPQDPAAISAQMAKMYGELETMLKKAKVEITGYPFAMYPAYSETSMDMICAMQVAADAKVPAKYKVETVEVGSAIKGIYKGDYNNLMALHMELDQYLQYKGLTMNGAPIEIYVTDPMLEKDTAKWITEIYYPIKKN
ncbi:MAG: SRPBCC family protein [Cyclobacteriaceae bacterium]|nr:SRPBCC family protein [Cyclobacteriaceae bacterium]